MAQQRTTYTVETPFPYKGAWTTKGQEVALLPVEARALLNAKRIRVKTTKAVSKTAAKQAK